MFTVRHIEPNENESIFSADSVAYAVNLDAKTSNEKVVFAYHGNGTTIIASGVVYVMNDSGKTVAVYSFPGPPPNHKFDRAGNAHAIAGLEG